MSKDDDSRRNQGPTDGMPRTVMEIITQEERGDRRLAHLALGLAVVVHAFIFVITWPSFAGATSKVGEKEPTVFVVEEVRFKPPPSPQERQIPRPQIQRVNVPDTTPHDPEPIRERTTMVEDVDFVDDPSVVFGVPEPPPPLEEEQGPVTWEAGGEVTEPVRVGGPNPVYSETAQKAHFSGSVVLECVIGTDGTVDSVKVVKALPFGLTESAAEAVRQWRFQPSTLNGKPVAVVYVLTVNFNLQQRRP